MGTRMELFKIAAKDGYEWEWHNLKLNTYDLYRMNLYDLCDLEIIYTEALEYIKQCNASLLTIEESTNMLEIIKLVIQDNLADIESSEK